MRALETPISQYYMYRHVLISDLLFYYADALTNTTLPVEIAHCTGRRVRYVHCPVAEQWRMARNSKF